MNDKQIQEFILKELSRFNFKKYTKGFRYLYEAIFLCIKDKDAIDNLYKNVFPIICEKYKEKTPLNVKWCIEQVIKTMYNNTEIHILCDYFNVSENIRPSLKFIIYTVVCNYEWNNLES